MRRWCLIALVLALIYIFNSGCVIPQSVPYAREGNYLQENQWRINSSTKAEVLNRSMPSVILEDENTFIYFWRDSDSAADVILYTASTGPLRMWNNYVGLIQFDKNDTLESIWSGKRPSYQSSVNALVYGPVATKMKNKKKELPNPPQTFLIMRVSINIDGKQLEKPMNYFIYERAGFTTMGKYIRIGDKSLHNRFRDAGWIVFEGEPGDLLYLSFSKGGKYYYDSGRKDASGKRIIPDTYSTPWRVEVPDASHAYIGTFQFKNSNRITKGNLLVECYEVLDESELARQMIAEQFPEDNDPVVALAEKYSGPVVLRTPFAYK
jgi:hypothetical protein